MTWPVSFERGRVALHVPDRGISTADAARQERTVQEILRRLDRQPGVILADEVGMGKTFVALAVAAFVAWTERRGDPVIVMVPPSVKDKWPREYSVFAEKCLAGSARLRTATATTGVDLLKRLDDSKRKRAQIIFATHGALHRRLTDRWTRLAFLQAAMHGRHLGKKRDALPQFAAEILQLKTEARDAEFYRSLLRSSPLAWSEVMRKHGIEVDDAPVPEAVVGVLKRRDVDLRGLDHALEQLPVRWSENIGQRTMAIRRELGRAVRAIWPQVLARARFRSPLLVLDEAHHLKNPATRLASLFAGDDAEGDATELDGALAGRFERMLFLTATPFQLGHGELLQVLDRFRAIDWKHGPSAMSVEQFDGARSRLRDALDEAQVATTQLDRQWQRIEPSEVSSGDADDTRVDSWWQRINTSPEQVPERLRAVVSAYRRAHSAMRAAESELAPWIIRHLRARTLPGSGEPRRRRLTGAAIRREDDRRCGIEVEESSLLPFLLAARAEAMVSHRSRLRGSGRATFAEGLASSYEAFLETRKSSQTDVSGPDVVDEDAWAGGTILDEADGQFHRYVDRLRASLPSEREYAAHPKIAATVARAAALWQAGEKVLIFCHFRATSRALESHLSRTLLDELQQRTAARLGIAPEAAMGELQRLAEGFEKPERRLHRALHDAILPIIRTEEALSAIEERVFGVVRRFVSRPAFLGRHIGAASENEAVELLHEALHTADESSLTLDAKIRGFVRFLGRRCVPEEREQYLAALETVETGMRREHLPSVRRCTGEVDEDTRRRVLLSFNTPFFPEILVASSVLAEGVDLHLACRHVIHHDLCWNPSTLEQRTGRVDRLGAKADTAGRSIHVYLPYIAQTQDEKMYRVVCDRERWFQVVMGEDYRCDEWATDRLAARLPLPESAARELAFRLSVPEAPATE